MRHIMWFFAIWSALAAPVSQARELPLCTDGNFAMIPIELYLSDVPLGEKYQKFKLGAWLAEKKFSVKIDSILVIDCIADDRQTLILEDRGLGEKGPPRGYVLFVTRTFIRIAEDVALEHAAAFEVCRAKAGVLAKPAWQIRMDAKRDEWKANVCASALLGETEQLKWLLRTRPP